MRAFLTGCAAATLLVIGTLIAARGGAAAYDGDWQFLALLALVSAGFCVGGVLILIPALEVHL